MWYKVGQKSYACACACLRMGVQKTENCENFLFTDVMAAGLLNKTTREFIEMLVPRMLLPYLFVI
jgi:hypothetical protein